MLSGAAARYGDFLRRPDVARMLALALVSRMPIGTLDRIRIFAPRYSSLMRSTGMGAPARA